MTHRLTRLTIAFWVMFLSAACIAEDHFRPIVWIYTDMSDPTIPGDNHRGTLNDPDDVSAMAGYLLMANQFETLGIVVASTHRKEHADTANQAEWANRLFGEAYDMDLVQLEKQLDGYPKKIEFTQSCIKETGESFAADQAYLSLENYSTVQSLVDAARHLQDGQTINVLCWGSLTEPAILVAHCLSTKNEALLKKLRFIAHWTDSPLHQGSPEHPENVANCREDAVACRYMKRIAGEGKIAYHECGAIGQHGIVSGSPKGRDYFDHFRVSRLGTIFVDGKFVQNSVDHSDSATYWVLLGGYGVSLKDIPGDGTNSAVVEKRNEDSSQASSKSIHDELLRRSQMAAGGVGASQSHTPLPTDPSELITALKLNYSGKVFYDAKSDYVEFLTSGTMPEELEAFYWDVPSSVQQIVISNNVTLTGGLRIRYRHANSPLRIEGRDRKTSILYGTEMQSWTEKNKLAKSDKWRYGSINVVEDAVVFVENMTSLNPRSYHVSGYANQAVLHLDGCDLLDTRSGENNNSDGFLGRAGSSIRNSLIRTGDDAVKVYHDLTIENVIIEQGRNGAALQFGWWDENDEADVTIRNLKIRGVSPNHQYNMAPLAWENGQRGIRNLFIDGLDVDVLGQMYDERTNHWVPLGLLELKPAGCVFNLSLKNSSLNGLGLGINHTQGQVSIDRQRKQPGDRP